MALSRNASHHVHAHGHDHGRADDHRHGDGHDHGNARPIGQQGAVSALAMSAPRRLGVAAGCVLVLWLAVFWAIAP
jgi:hypothetical protein